MRRKSPTFFPGHFLKAAVSPCCVSLTDGSAFGHGRAAAVTSLLHERDGMQQHPLRCVDLDLGKGRSVVMMR